MLCKQYILSYSKLQPVIRVNTQQLQGTGSAFMEFLFGFIDLQILHDDFDGSIFKQYSMATLYRKCYSAISVPLINRKLEKILPVIG